jgi:hypothetical protein
MNANADNKLADALRAYVRTVEHAQRFVNPEEWETHIDWRKLAADAAAALAELDKPRTLAAACHALADELRMRRDSLPGARTIPTARAQFDLSTVERHLHGIADNMDTSPADYGDPTRPGDCLRLDHFALQRDGLQLVTDSQDVRAVVDSLSAAELDAAGLHADDVSGALVAAANGDYSEVWITEGARPFDLTGCNYARAR